MKIYKNFILSLHENIDNKYFKDILNCIQYDCELIFNGAIKPIDKGYIFQADKKIFLQKFNNGIDFYNKIKEKTKFKYSLFKLSQKFLEKIGGYLPGLKDTGAWSNYAVFNSNNTDIASVWAGIVTSLSNNVEIQVYRINKEVENKNTVKNNLTPQSSNIVKTVGVKWKAIGNDETIPEENGPYLIAIETYSKPFKFLNSDEFKVTKVNYSSKVYDDIEDAVKEADRMMRGKQYVDSGARGRNASSINKDATSNLVITTESLIEASKQKDPTIKFIKNN